LPARRRAETGRPHDRRHTRTTTNQEAEMGKAIPTQHPAVVLRSHFNFVRALLAVAMVAVVGLTVAVVIVANDIDEVTGTSSAKTFESINYGGFNPATGRPDAAPLPQQEHPLQSQVGGLRYDGGPEEGTAHVTPPQQRPTEEQTFPGLARQAQGALGGSR
jgi:hypothetical protein